MRPRYDAIGANYAVHRRPDPHIEAQIHAALGDARTVLTRDYVPDASGAEWSFAALPEILGRLGAARVERVPIPHDCRDGFLRAYWRRPEAYLDPDVRASISALALVDDAVLAPGIARLRADLASGAWHERNAGLLDAAALDLGYRLVIAGQGVRPQ